MKSKVIVSGVGMVPFLKPGKSAPYYEMGANAARLAIEDAGIPYSLVEQAYVGWVYGDSTSGQAALYKLGLTGIPIVNVNNNCSTGSTALYLARQAVETGAVECAIALGFEQMNPGALDTVFNDRPTPFESFTDIADSLLNGGEEAPTALRLFGGAGYEYQSKYGLSDEVLAKVRVKASIHASNNEKAVFRTILTEEEVMTGDKVFLNLTKLHCCPPTCGAAAAIVCSEKFAKKHGLKSGVAIIGQSMKTDMDVTFSGKSMIDLVGYDMSQKAAEEVYEKASIGPGDVDVVELHDCFVANEIITYESIGLCEVGGAEKFINDGNNTYGGSVVTNPSGGLLSKGHPLGATGLAQCAELVWQLRGEAGPRQVDNARIGLQHNLGLGGACVVTAYQKIN